MGLIKLLVFSEVSNFIVKICFGTQTFSLGAILCKKNPIKLMSDLGAKMADLKPKMFSISKIVSCLAVARRCMISLGNYSWKEEKLIISFYMVSTPHLTPRNPKYYKIRNRLSADVLPYRDSSIPWDYLLLNLPKHTVALLLPCVHSSDRVGLWQGTNLQRCKLTQNFWNNGEDKCVVDGNHPLIWVLTD